MKFASTVDVIVDERNEPFNAISIYIPSFFAAANIVDFDPALMTVERPWIQVCTVDNYKTIMKGKLLDQWLNAFRQDTNIALVLYVIVFQADASTSAMWDIDDVSVRFGPLTRAFEKLYSISYIKVLFDEKYTGEPVPIPADPGTPAQMTIVLRNTTADELVVPAGTYVYNDGTKDFEIVIPQDSPMQAYAESAPYTMSATTVGVDATLQTGVLDNNEVTPNPPADLAIECASVVQGTEPYDGPTEMPSKYFDMSLALAYLCKLDTKLSYFFSLVKTSFIDEEPNPDDYCWIRLKTSVEEKAAMTSLLTGDRDKYYWGALYLMECANTWVLAHSEPVNIIAEVMAAWFAERNGSGQYIGNKMSLLRLSGTRIKPYGFPSWIVGDINENDVAGFDFLDTKNVGYLSSIADNTPQESCISKAHSVTGIPVAATMISRFVDYLSAQDCAKMITATGTLVDPMLTDEDAYKKIQKTVYDNLLRFVMTRRISQITLSFPEFSVAKTGMTKIEAASSWKARYTDDLDSVTVTGGITAA
jgi:hypothetical protein